MKRLFLLFLALTTLSKGFCEDHTINFSSVKASELVRFISKVTKSNFLFNEKDLNFDVTFICGRSSSEREILESMVTLLDHHNFRVKGKSGNYVIEKKASSAPSQPFISIPKEEAFSVYKLQFHKGDEILAAVKELAATSTSDPDFMAAVHSMQWLKSTNSLVLSGSGSTSDKVIGLVRTLDTPQKQVFIEILVVETDINKSHEFGLNWSAGAQYKNRFSASVGNGMANFNGSKNAAGLPNIPVGKGFDLGVIGDLIAHKGATFLSLGSLVSAVQLDHDASIVLNQKIIAQDNKPSTIFVGQNIPFAGAVTETVGQTQQTTANIEYKDVGTSLHITPYIGEKGIITLEIDEEISEATDREVMQAKQVNGIETTKTNMSTRVHVPDSHFLVLTGMARNYKKQKTTGIPCLGGLPWIGALFSKKESKTEKRNFIIFVHPHIINSFDEYEELSQEHIDTLKESRSASDLINDIILPE